MAADETIFWRFLVERFFDFPVKTNSSFPCFLMWSWRSSIRKSGILKILSLFPLAWRMWPIFSWKFRFCIFRLTSSETRNPQAYIRLIISFDFWVWRLSRSFFTSSFDNVIGRRFSFLGRLIEAVMSWFRMLEWAYLIAARKRMIEVAARSVRFSDM